MIQPAISQRQGRVQHRVHRRPRRVAGPARSRPEADAHPAQRPPAVLPRRPDAVLLRGEPLADGAGRTRPVRTTRVRVTAVRPSTRTRGRRRSDDCCGPSITDCPRSRGGARRGKRRLAALARRHRVIRSTSPPAGRRPPVPCSTGTHAARATDGGVGDDARWVSARTPGPHWLQIDLPASLTIGSAHLYTGWGDQDPVKNFRLESWDGSAWKPVAGTKVSGNTDTARVLPFDEPIETTRIRLVVDDAGPARVKELLLWAPVAGAGKASPEIGVGVRGGTPPPDPTRHHVLVNQVGYNLRVAQAVHRPALAGRQHVPGDRGRLRATGLRGQGH